MQNFDNAKVIDKTNFAAAGAASEFSNARTEAYSSMSDMGKRNEKSQGYPMPKLDLGDDNAKNSKMDQGGKKGGKDDLDFNPARPGGTDGGMKENFGEKGKGGKDGLEGKDGKESKEGKDGKESKEGKDSKSDKNGKDLKYEDPNGAGDLKNEESEDDRDGDDEGESKENQDEDNEKDSESQHESEHDDDSMQGLQEGEQGGGECFGGIGGKDGDASGKQHVKDPEEPQIRDLSGGARGAQAA